MSTAPAQHTDSLNDKNAKSIHPSSGANGSHAVSENLFERDLNAIRNRANGLLGGEMGQQFTLDKKELIVLLNDALAVELVCALRYRQHAYRCKGIMGKIVAEEFNEHAREEMEHADALAARIDQLGGAPDFLPDIVLKRSAEAYPTTASMQQLLREDLRAERVAIQLYTDLLHYVGDRDRTTQRMLETILAKEEEHAADLDCLLQKEAPEQPRLS